MKKQLVVALAAAPALVLSLAACGGGGGGGGALPAPSPPPTPVPPTPAPPPPQAPPPGPLPTLGMPNMGAIGGATTFLAASAMAAHNASSGAYIFTYPTSYYAPPGAETVRYDPADGSFTFTLDSDRGWPEYAQTFRAGDIVASTADATVYERDGDRLEIFKPRGATFETGYVSLAAWRTDSAAYCCAADVLDDAHGVTLFGFQTPFTQMPNSGKATYSVDVRGSYVGPGGWKELGGDGSIVADFSASLLSAEMSLTTLEASGARAPWLVFRGPAIIQAGPLAGGSNLFRGAAELIGASGPAVAYSGAFYGPSAAEVGGAFWLQTGTEQANGGFVGATRDATAPRSGLNASLRSLGVSESFTVHSIELGLGIAADGSGDRNTARAVQPIGLLETVAYDAATGAFLVPTRLAAFTGDAATQLDLATVRPADRDAAASRPDRSVYVVNRIGPSPGQRVTLYTPGASPYALDYAAIGAWEDLRDFPYVAATQVFSSPFAKYFVYGAPTASLTLPASGSATYDIDAVGLRYTAGALSNVTGEGAITAHFDTDRFDLGLDLYDDRSGAPALWRSFAATGAGRVVDDPANDPAARFTSWEGYGDRAAIFTIDAPATGGSAAALSLTGSFYGPDAAEIGGAFGVGEPGGADAAAGAFVGEKRP